MVGYMLFAHDEHSDLRHASAASGATTFTCPLCAQEVQLRAGTRRDPHFAHLGTGDCPGRHRRRSGRLPRTHGGEQLELPHLDPPAPHTASPPAPLRIVAGPELTPSVRDAPRSPARATAPPPAPRTGWGRLRRLLLGRHSQ